MLFLPPIIANSIFSVLLDFGKWWLFLPISGQRILSVQGVVCNLFRFGRHLTRAMNYRVFRSRAFIEWPQIAYA